MLPEISGVGVLSAILAGFVSFVSPCVLPLVPGYVSFVAGRSPSDLNQRSGVTARLSTIGLSLAFVLGFSSIFISLGASATAIGQVFQSYRFEANYVAGAIVALFGLQMMGALKLSWLHRDFRFQGYIVGGRPLGAFLLGAAFAFGWTPCIGPILGAILTISATTMDPSSGVALLALYSLGLAVPFLLVAAFTDYFIVALKRVRWLGAQVQRVAGGVLVLVGVGMVTGYLNAAGTWLLVTFPIFQQSTL
jgi:cytochrome c-type biogenesis protein